MAPQPGTSKATPGIKIYPYLLRKLSVVQANRVLALPPKVAITLEACHAVEIIEEAFVRFGLPEMVNTDQGSQFTASDFTDAVRNKGCKLSIDGRGAWRDNVFVERVWRSAKYEESTSRRMTAGPPSVLTLPNPLTGKPRRGCI